MGNFYVLFKISLQYLYINGIKHNFASNCFYISDWGKFFLISQIIANC